MIECLPSVLLFSQRLVQLLKPYKEEREKTFYKSLKSNLDGEPLAFRYDPTESKKKHPRDDDDEEEEDNHADNVSALTYDQLDRVAEAAINKVMVQMKAFIKEYNDANKELVEEYHSKLVDDVAENVIKSLLKRAPDYMEPVDDNRHHHNNWAHTDQNLQVYAEEGKSLTPVNHDKETTIGEKLEAALATLAPAPHQWRNHQQKPPQRPQHWQQQWDRA